LNELECLYQLGWRGSVFMVDDNFIGNKRNVKLLLKSLKGWMDQHQYPFQFVTEASVDLAQDTELMEAMVECNFHGIFLGLETPDEASLTLTKKFQNTRDSLSESVETITRIGLRVMAGFIIGFDGEKSGAGDRIVRFVEKTAIPLPMFSMLQALPHTALWERLQQEGRLLEQGADINQMTLMNFIPTRSLEEIAREYIEAFWQLYDPEAFLDRAYRHYRMMGAPRNITPGRPLNLSTIRALSIIFWRQGIIRKTRWRFWINLVQIIRHNPKVLDQYVMVCGLFEHFFEYRQIVCDQINRQLANYLANYPSQVPVKEEILQEVS
jgi:radical SAM superfamily enzyme YgiQ (UPF0313 family)